MTKISACGGPAAGGQNSKQLGIWKIGICDLFGIWDLGFGASAAMQRAVLQGGCVIGVIRYGAD